jgi:hypothetical protein
MRKFLIAITIPFALLLAGCVESSPPSARDTQARAAAEAANSISFTANAEIDNIKRRLELTSDPGRIGFIVLLNESGQPVMYTSVRGKITSSGKRLTNPTRINRYEGNNGSVSVAVGPAPSDEGTWGSSDPYIYFWTIGGQYIQWSGEYLYSDQPIRLSVQPLVIEVGEKK